MVATPSEFIERFGEHGHVPRIPIAFFEIWINIRVFQNRFRMNADVIVDDE